MLMTEKEVKDLFQKVLDGWQRIRPYDKVGSLEKKLIDATTATIVCPNCDCSACKHEASPLTLKDLEAMNAGEIFSFGESVDSESGLHLDRTGNELTWIAVRGGGHYDWAIYVGLKGSPHEQIKRVGIKVCSEENIRRVVPCDDEAYNHYRR